MTVVPQQYRLHCVFSGWYNNFEWYYNNTQHNCTLQQFGYSCQNSPFQFLYGINSTKFHALTVTWDAEKINSGIFSQSNYNGNHIHRCYLRAQNVERNHYLTVTGKYFYYYSYMISYVVLSAPGFTPFFTTLVNKTTTTITVNWRTPVPSDADGYVVNATSDTHTVTQQVKGGSQNEITLKGLMPATTYNITVRAYQDILGPASTVISVQTNINLTTGIEFGVLF